MSPFLIKRNPIYPLFTLLSAIIVLVYGMVMSKEINTLYFFLGVTIIYLLFGYYKAVLVSLPIIAILLLIFSGLTYIYTKDNMMVVDATNRVLAIFVACIPSLSLSPFMFTKNLETLKLNRTLTLGMLITVSFFPLLGNEIKRVKNAMKTRGAGSIINPQIFYRAFFLPLIIRLINISDTLAMSVETRGFSMSNKGVTLYKKVVPHWYDFIYLLLIISGVLLAYFL